MSFHDERENTMSEKAFLTLRDLRQKVTDIRISLDTDRDLMALKQSHRVAWVAINSALNQAERVIDTEVLAIVSVLQRAKRETRRHLDRLTRRV